MRLDCERYQIEHINSSLLSRRQVRVLPDDVDDDDHGRDTCCEAQQTSPAHHCTVLPPGEFSSMMPIQLLIYREMLLTIAVTVFTYCCHGNIRRDSIVKHYRSETTTPLSPLRRKLGYRHCDKKLVRSFALQRRWRSPHYSDQLGGC